MTTQTTPPPTQERASQHWRGPVLVAAFIVVALIVTGLVAGWRTYRSPGVFYAVPDVVSTWGTWPVNTPNSYGMSYAHKGVDPAEVSIVSATPNVLVNTAKATIVVRVCTIDRTSGVGAIGSVHYLRKECSRLVPPDGTTMTLGTYADQLVLTIVPTQPGMVLVKGLHVTYSHGWRRGTQDIGEFVRVRAT